MWLSPLGLRVGEALPRVSVPSVVESGVRSFPSPSSCEIGEAFGG